jgi:hypothetical protein
MYPVHDVDAILLLSMALAAKRRPAELVDIIAAIDLAQGAIPSEIKLSDAFARLSAYGLIVEVDGGYTLSPDAQQMMASQRKKDDTEKRIFRLKENLADYHLQGEHTTIQVTEALLLAAVQSHQAAKAGTGRNLLVPKPKPVEDSRRPVPYKHFSARRRKD